MKIGKLLQAVILLLVILSVPGPRVFAEDSITNQLGLGDEITKGKFRDQPTHITSNSLNVDSENRVFTYRGDVKVRQGDMTVLCEELEGRYSAGNQIETLIARRNVVMTKGDKMKATAQKAHYNAKEALLTLTENPSLEQNGSTLAADVIKIFLEEDKSVAEGEVRVSLAPRQTPAQGATTPGASKSLLEPTPSPTSEPTSIPGVRVLGKGQ